MHVYLIRHAHAGQREEGIDDRSRPLSDKGIIRAEELVTLLAQRPIDRIVSSPAVRCVQTVEPLAQARGLGIGLHDVLWEDASATDTLAFLENVLPALSGLVVCSHGNIIPELLDLLDRRQVPVIGHGCEKGSVWVLTHLDGRWTDARRVKKKAQAL